MIEKLPEKKYVSEGEVVAKLNELIEAHNNHFHRADPKIIFINGTDRPNYYEKEDST